jgi:hypothetical protein
MFIIQATGSVACNVFQNALAYFPTAVSYVRKNVYQIATCGQRNKTFYGHDLRLFIIG